MKESAPVTLLATIVFMAGAAFAAALMQFVVFGKIVLPFDIIAFLALGYFIGRLHGARLP